MVAQVFGRWDQSGVVWALLRVPENLAAPEGDIDIVLQPATAQRAYDIARSQGFVTVPGYAPDTHLARWERETRRWLWLHCTTQPTFGPFAAVRLSADDCLAERFTDGPLSRVGHNEEFWITLMHALLDTRGLTDRARRRIRSTVAYARADGALPTALGTVLPPGWTPRRVMELTQTGHWDALAHLAGPTQKRALHLGRPSMIRRVARALARRLRDGPSGRQRRGASVALIGPDGAGKSTLADGLEKEFVFPVTRIYMGLTGGWLRQADRLRVPGVVRIGRLSIIWARYLQGRYHTRRGRLVVFDRYTYDAVAPAPYRTGWLRRVGRWIDGHSCPSPDLVLILDAPGRVMYARKGAYDPQLLDAWARRFRAWSRGRPNTVILDGSQSAEQVLGAAMDRIWAHYLARWGAG